MFTRSKQLQYPVRVAKPNPMFARQLQELLGGKYGEMTVMMQYLFQGWGIRGTDGNAQMTKIKDMALDMACEEIAHVEMLSTMIAMLLDGASPEQQTSAAQASPAVMAVLAGMNPQHIIASGLAAMPADSNGNPWNGTYVEASGNIVADLYNNANKEMNGRLQTARVYELTDDPGVRDTLQFMLARDLAHQLQWLAAIEELGSPKDVLPVPQTFPRDQIKDEYAYTFMSYSKNPAETTAGQGRWAKGPAPDGKGQFNYIAEPFAMGEAPVLSPAPAKVWNALPGQPTGQVVPPAPVQKQPVQQAKAQGENILEKIGDKLVGSE